MSIVWVMAIVTASLIAQCLTLTKVCFLLMLMSHVNHIWLGSLLSSSQDPGWSQRSTSMWYLADHWNTEKREQRWSQWRLLKHLLRRHTPRFCSHFIGQSRSQDQPGINEQKRITFPQEGSENIFNNNTGVGCHGLLLTIENSNQKVVKVQE